MKPSNKKRRKRPRRQDGYFGSWEQERALKAKKLKREFEKIRAWIDRYLEDHPEYRHLKSMMMLWIMMKRYGLSIRGMIAELHFRRGSLKAACLKWVPSKSRLHTSGCTDGPWRCSMILSRLPRGLRPAAASPSTRPTIGSTSTDCRPAPATSAGPTNKGVLIVLAKKNGKSRDDRKV